jgi:hypothetical protein
MKPHVRGKVEGGRGKGGAYVFAARRFGGADPEQREGNRADANALATGLVWRLGQCHVDLSTVGKPPKNVWVDFRVRGGSRGGTQKRRPAFLSTASPQFMSATAARRAPASTSPLHGQAVRALLIAPPIRPQQSPSRSKPVRALRNTSRLPPASGASSPESADVLHSTCESPVALDVAQPIIFASLLAHPPSTPEPPFSFSLSLSFKHACSACSLRRPLPLPLLLPLLPGLLLRPAALHPLHPTGPRPLLRRCHRRRRVCAPRLRRAGAHHRWWP